MNYPDFSFHKHTQSFDKDAQGAHELIETFKNEGENFTYRRENYDAYRLEWSTDERTGKIIAYFPEQSLVKLRYNTGVDGFLDLKSQNIDSNNQAFFLHFYRPDFFPLDASKIQELTNLLAMVLSEIEQRTMHFVAPNLPNRQWIESVYQGEFGLAYWLSPSTEWSHLEIVLKNNALRQVPYSLKVGAYPHNLYLSCAFLPQAEPLAQRILSDFVSQNSAYRLSK
jgi:hypothetical protein